MDVSPRALRAVTFREKLRGYHPDDVDQFLERVAEGVAALQAKLDDAVARAQQAEQTTSDLSEGEEAVRRTLSLAQRTADMAIKEAKEEAARLVADARDTAERTSIDAQRELRADLERLETARKQLHADVVAMQHYVENERVQIRNALADVLRKVEGTARKAPPPPEAAQLDIPAAPPPRRVVVDPEPPPPPSFPPAAPEGPITAETPVLKAPALDPAEPEPSVFVAAEPEPAAPDFETVVRREPQPPPVVGTRFAQARPAGGRPTAPPPGPRRIAATSDVAAEAEPEANEGEMPDDERHTVRRLFGR